MTEIVKTIIWPVTIIVIVILLRRPLSELVPSLKKLKYKEFELDFEKEAQRILADTERDIPKVETETIKESSSIDSDDIQFAARKGEPFATPAGRIMSCWRELELFIRDLSQEENSSKKSIGQIIHQLLANQTINEETYDSLRSLASLRNRIAHSSSEEITEKTADSYTEAASRVLTYLLTIWSNKS